jgi:hypothetical protein
MSAVVALSKEESMSDVHILAIDLAKRSFQVCATDRVGRFYSIVRFRARS